MEKTCKNESLLSKDSVCLCLEGFPYHPLLSLWRRAEKALVTTGSFWSEQVFLPLTKLCDWCSLVHRCPSSSTLSLWALLLSLPEKQLSGRPKWHYPVWLSKYREAIQRGVPGRCRLGYVQDAGDTLLCTSSHSMWWAPQQGGHSDVFLRWGLACELKRFTAGEQDRDWGNNYKRYRQSLSCEEKKHTLHFSPLTQNFGARLISLDSSIHLSWLQLFMVQLSNHISIPVHS